MERQPGYGSGRRNLSYRSRHRTASHDAAHDADIQHAKPPEHPLIPAGPADLIVDDVALTSLIADLRGAGAFAYDTEFIGEMTYDPQLCLVQVATASRISLIDPLAGVDLRPFWELLADASVEKFVHAGPQDVEPVFRNVNKAAANVFDTQIAAGFCSMAYPVALAKLVGELLGHKMQKGLTFTDWQRRPLSASQLHYAADDVRFLPAMCDELKRRLRESGHEKYVIEECAAMCEPTRYTFDAEADYSRIRGAGTLSTPQLSVLRALMIWREEKAIEADSPPRAYIRDEAMLDMARRPAKTPDRLLSVKFLPRPIIEEFGGELVRITLAALANVPASLKRQPSFEPTPTERFRAESLWAATQTICLSQGIDPAVVTSRSEVGDLDRALAEGQSVDQMSLMSGWRREAVGEKLLALVHEQDALGVNWADGRLHDSRGTHGD